MIDECQQWLEPLRDLEAVAVATCQLSARAISPNALAPLIRLNRLRGNEAGPAYLKHLPMDFLKIDREFVRDAMSSDGDQHVIRAIVGLARGFGLQTIAEGIEDHRQLLALRRLGADMAQGYHFGRPGPPDAVTRQLVEYGFGDPAAADLAAADLADLAAADTSGEAVSPGEPGVPSQRAAEITRGVDIPLA